VFLVHVLSRVHGVSSVRNYAQALYFARFAALFPDEGLFLRQQGALFQCVRDQHEVYTSIISRCEISSSFSSSFHAKPIDAFF
jgi:hypothetical protein